MAKAPLSTEAVFNALEQYFNFIGLHRLKTHKLLERLNWTINNGTGDNLLRQSYHLCIYNRARKAFWIKLTATKKKNGGTDKLRCYKTVDQREQTCLGYLLTF